MCCCWLAAASKYSIQLAGMVNWVWQLATKGDAIISMTRFSLFVYPRLPVVLFTEVLTGSVQREVLVGFVRTYCVALCMWSMLCGSVFSTWLYCSKSRWFYAIVSYLRINSRSSYVVRWFFTIFEWYVCVLYEKQLSRAVPSQMRFLNKRKYSASVFQHFNTFVF